MNQLVETRFVLVPESQASLMPRYLLSCCTEFPFADWDDYCSAARAVELAGSFGFFVGGNDAVALSATNRYILTSTNTGVASITRLLIVRYLHMQCEWKTRHPARVDIFSANINTDFRNCFTARFSTKFATNWSLHSHRHESMTCVFDTQLSL